MSASPGIVNNLSHVNEAAALLTAQLQSKANVNGILQSYVARIQELENVFYSISTTRLLATASGNVLDQYGKLLDVGRAGLDDTHYRIVIAIRLRVLRSKGQPKDIIEVVLLALQGTSATANYSEPDVPAISGHLNHYPWSWVVSRGGPLARWVVDIFALPVWIIGALTTGLTQAKSAGTTGNLTYTLDTFTGGGTRVNSFVFGDSTSSTYVYGTNAGGWDDSVSTPLAGAGYLGSITEL